MARVASVASVPVRTETRIGGRDNFSHDPRVGGDPCTWKEHLKGLPHARGIFSNLSLVLSGFYFYVPPYHDHRRNAVGGSGDVHIDFHVVRHHSLNIARTTSLCAWKIKLAELCTLVLVVGGS